MLLSTAFAPHIVAQDTDTDAPEVYGQITDEEGQPIVGVNVIVEDASSGIGTATDEKGNYRLVIPADRWVNLIFSFVGMETKEKSINLSNGQTQKFNVELKSLQEELPDFKVRGIQDRTTGMTMISPKMIEALPTARGIEDAIALQAGVVNNNELSSQYSVRGGNFDENLVYVNDFEIYRPFLIRSGQQEGLSFINPDLVRSVAFSAGGFETRYGDKLSSVLDVKYRKPKNFGGSISASLLGINGHLEGTLLKKKLSYIVGVRQRISRYLFNSLPTEGQYNPSFSDVQSFITYRFNKRWEIQFITNFARNIFDFIPESQTTSFGTFNQALQLQLFYEGREKDSYQTLMGGTSLTYLSKNNKLSLKFLTSAYRNREIEAFNIRAGYLIGEVETDLGSDNLGEITRTLGVGVLQDWARNRLDTDIANVAHRGHYDRGRHFLSWGVKYQREQITDQLNEWEKLDSAEFSKPTDPNQLLVQDVLKTEIKLNSNRFSGFLQDDWNISADRLKMTGGVRFSYWDVNKELTITPRLQLVYQPTIKATPRNPKKSVDAVEKDLLLRLAVGAYYQPPFYRELRNFEGEINRDLQSQKSIHVVLGSDYTFNIWNRPFKFTSELYYKHLWDLVPYDLDNLLIRYFGENRAKGYAAGVDMRLFGEFVPGIDSWLSLSVMQAKEKLDDYFYTNITEQTNDDGEVTAIDTTTVQVGYVPRPTDQRVTFGMFFQDYLPNNKNFKMHLRLLFGTGLPFNPPNGNPQFRGGFRIPTYRRVDIGFSALLFDKKRKELPERSVMRHFDSIWASVEIFNLLGVGNVINFNWIEAFNGLTYAVPNRLTARRVNARMIVKF